MEMLKWMMGKFVSPWCGLIGHGVVYSEAKILNCDVDLLW